MSTPSATTSGLRDWRLGAIRGVRKAAKFSGLSRHEIVALTDANIIAWFPHKERGDRMISKRSLIEYLARLCAAHEAANKE
ncbi:unnamed protein product [Gemmata massiliana]|uniref:Uncharacterized protein n=1 Tax=Gemmata massiliana TaxID=1210884 RepID=A0A6P2D925_9BACT|nr:hypothetical protein [Gemmata massiliana]VTR97851.1 unnamed protein product [Gemmata massiliana]